MRDFLVRHYELELDIFYIAVLAFLIFFMHLFTGVQIGLVVACALVLVWILHARDTDQRPCGAEVSGEPVSRSRGGFQAH
jgi:MFS superfamily sulfate permease-like transporter